MPSYYEIRWLPEGRIEGFAGSRGNYYEISESDRLNLHSEPVWCHRCGEITDGEDLSTVEDIDAQMCELQDPSSVLYCMTRHGMVDKLLGTGDEHLQQLIAELQRRRQWREGRRSPPKCLHCGTTDILVLPLGVPVPNPKGDGELQIDWAGFCSTYFNEWYFTPEGDRIPRDTRPTYWHHPELEKRSHGDL